MMIRGIRRYGLLLHVLFLALSTGAFGQGHGYPPGGDGGQEPVAPPDMPTSEDTEQAVRLRAIQNGEYVRQSMSVRRMLTRIGRGMDTGHGDTPIWWLVEPGVRLNTLDAMADLSWGELNLKDVNAAGDDLGGTIRESNLFLALPLGDRLYAGAGLTESRTRLRGTDGWEVETAGADAYAAFRLTETLAAGLFTMNRQVDLERRNGNGYEHLGAVDLSGVLRFGPMDLTVTGAVAKTIQDVATREHDTVFYALTDLQTYWTKWLRSSVYAYLNESLRDSPPADRTFWTAGVDLEIVPCERLVFSVGYEETLAAKDHEESRVNTSVRVRW